MTTKRAINRHQVELEQTLKEIATRARDLLEFQGGELNWYSDITARADTLRLIRASVELAPTVKPAFAEGQTPAPPRGPTTPN